MTEHFPQKEEWYRIMGACFAVYNDFGDFPKVEHERFLIRVKRCDQWLF